MRIYSISEQINACIKHANRNKLPIHHLDVYANRPLDNHNVIMTVGNLRTGHPYISLAVLINIREKQREEKELIAAALKWMPMFNL